MTYRDLKKGQVYVFLMGSYKVVMLYMGNPVEPRHFMNMEGTYSYGTCCSAEGYPFREATEEEKQKLITAIPPHEFEKLGLGDLIINDYPIY